MSESENAETPETMVVCRMCLIADVPMYDIADTILQLVYESLMKTPLIDNGKPTVVCALCQYSLEKGRDLMRRSREADELLFRMLKDFPEATTELTAMIDHQTNNLCPPLKITPVEYFDNTTFDVPISIKHEPNPVDSVENIGGIYIIIEDHLSQNTPACRICLAVNLRTMPIANPLQNVYESITGNLLHTPDKRTTSACYICHAQLNKCHNLMLRCNRADGVLTAILENYSELSPKLLSAVDRDAHHLSSSLKTRPVEYNDSLSDVSVVKKCGSDFMTVEVKIEVDPDLYVGSPQAVEDGDDYTKSRGTQVETWDLEVDANQDGGAPIPKTRAKRRRKCTEKTKKQTDETNTEQPKRAKQRRVYKKRIRAYIHECSICQRMFNRTNHLKDHMKTHTDDRPYECSYCKRRFIQKINFKNHLMTHTGEKPFECHICRSSFIAKSDFKRHMNTHNEERNFACTICSRRFTQMPYLKAHISTHTSEKPYECHICNRRFSQKPYLKNHLKRHTE